MNVALLTFSDYPWRSGGVNQLIHSLADFTSAEAAMVSGRDVCTEGSGVTT